MKTCICEKVDPTSLLSFAAGPIDTLSNNSCPDLCLGFPTAQALPEVESNTCLFQYIVPCMIEGERRVRNKARVISCIKSLDLQVEQRGKKWRCPG